jgi:hypothetical protein
LISLLLGLPKYQKTPSVQGGVTLCFLVAKVTLFPKENGSTDGVVSGETPIALLNVNLDAPARLAQLGSFHLAEVFNDTAANSLGFHGGSG